MTGVVELLGVVEKVRGVLINAADTMGYRNVVDVK